MLFFISCLLEFYILLYILSHSWVTLSCVVIYLEHVIETSVNPVHININCPPPRLIYGRGELYKQIFELGEILSFLLSESYPAWDWSGE